jgi:heme/copper-type cytochrome/quinol oxidase subunit 2
LSIKECLILSFYYILSISNFQLEGGGLLLNYFYNSNVGFSSSFYSFYMDWFHNFNCCLIFGVLLFVSLVLLYLFIGDSFVLVVKEYRWGELLCGTIPVFILVFQIVPSLGLLYYYGLMSLFSDFGLKVIGHQWYWRYDYSDLSDVCFDSYIKSSEVFSLGDFRLLDVDCRCILPASVDVRFFVTSLDVVHSWTIFNLFVKMDALGGFINVFCFRFPVIGVFFGQCSEICGINHRFMPIVLEVTSFELFKYWCLSF